MLPTAIMSAAVRRPVRIAILMACPVVALLVVCALLELALTIDHVRKEAARNKEATYYPWSVYSSDGTQLGSSTGPLQLVLKPFVLFGNRPNQRMPEFTIDARGFRGTAGTSSGPRIIVIGASTAFGTGLRHDEETFAHQLRLLLDVDVVNAAVIGYQSGSELIDLLTRLVDLQPSLVITLDGWNDYRYRPHFEELERQLKRLHRFTDANLMVRAASVPLVLFPRTGAWIADRVGVILSPGGATAARVDDAAVSAS